MMLLEVCLSLAAVLTLTVSAAPQVALKDAVPQIIPINRDSVNMGPDELPYIVIGNRQNEGTSMAGFNDGTYEEIIEDPEDETSEAVLDKSTESKEEERPFTRGVKVDTDETKSGKDLDVNSEETSGTRTKREDSDIVRDIIIPGSCDEAVKAINEEMGIVTDTAQKQSRVRRRLQMGFLHMSKPSRAAINGSLPKIDNLFDTSASEIRRSQRRDG